MVPSQVIVLDALPLTPNGKIDRKALPPPDAIRVAPVDARVAPRTPVEEVVARVWSDVLGVEAIGAHENFFELGGHSLRAMQVVSRLKDAVGLDVPVRAIFDAPTVAGLASVVAALLLAQPLDDVRGAAADGTGRSGPAPVSTIPRAKHRGP